MQNLRGDNSRKHRQPAPRAHQGEPKNRVQHKRAAPSVVGAAAKSSVYGEGAWTARIPTTTWIEAQKEDTVIGEVIQAKLDHGDRNIAARTKRLMSSAARRYSGKIWQSIQFVDGVLCRVTAGRRGEGPSIRKIVPRGWRQKVFQILHGAPIGGHMGFDKTYSIMKDRFYWPGMAGDCKKLLSSCQVCASFKPPPTRNTMPLNQDLASYPLERLAMDSMSPRSIVGSSV